MLKKVPTEKLVPGMFIHDMNCEWVNHPFLRNRFALSSEAEVRKILEHGIREVYIDTERGLDLQDAPSAQQVRTELDAQMVDAASAAKPAATGYKEEFARARKVHGEANALVHGLMQDVRLGKQVQVEQVEPVVSKITDSILRNQDALLSLCRVKTKDDYTFAHSVSVCALLVAFGRALDLDAETIRQAGIGGLLHDVGKIRVPDEILNKPGRLTDAEFAVMKGHVVESRRVLEESPGVPPLALQVAVEHHERYDGSGYAAGLKGEQISRIGQMAAICDVYDAITSDRCYHKGMPPTEALRKIFEWSKFHFNPQLTQAFLRCIGIYPVGSLVMLESARLALVTEQHDADLLRPTVRVVFHARANHYLKPEDIDLSRTLGHGGGDRIVAHEDPAKWGIDPLRFM